MKSRKTFSDPQVARFSEWVAQHLGLHFPAEREADLRRALSKVCQEMRLESPESCMSVLMAGPPPRAQSEILASYLTIGETYFFREKKLWEALETVVLPSILREHHSDERCLRIWSAGCASGEEAYSLAILLHRLKRELENWRVTILATDINTGALQRAAAGVYSEWSFRDTPDWVKRSCFEALPNGQYKLIEPVRRMVSFGYLNLAEDMYPSLVNNTTGMDLILCRNVLMYFVPQVARRVMEKFALAAAVRGWLSVSPYDAFHLQGTAFQAAPIPQTSLFRKGVEARPHGLRNRALEVTRPGQPVQLTPMEPAEPVGTTANDPLRVRPGEPQPPARSDRDFRSRAAELLAEGNYIQAAELGMQWLQVQPGAPPAMELLARACANQGKLQEALQWCDHGLQADSLEPRLHFLRGTVLQEQGRLQEAVQALKRVVYLEPDFVLAHFALGNLCQQIGANAEAVTELNRALGLLERCNPDEPVPESEGMTAGRLREIIRSTRQTDLAA